MEAVVAQGRQTSLYSRLFTLIVMVILLCNLGCHHGAKPEMSPDPIGGYEFGQSREASVMVEEEIRAAIPPQVKEIEVRLLAVSESPDAIQLQRHLQSEIFGAVAANLSRISEGIKARLYIRTSSIFPRKNRYRPFRQPISHPNVVARRSRFGFPTPAVCS